MAPYEPVLKEKDKERREGKPNSGSPARNQEKRVSKTREKCAAVDGEASPMHLYSEFLTEEYNQENLHQLKMDRDRWKDEVDKLQKENSELNDKCATLTEERDEKECLLHQSIVTARRDLKVKDDEILKLRNQLHAPTKCPSCGADVNIRPPKPKNVKVISGKCTVEVQFRNQDSLKEWTYCTGLSHNSDGLPTLPEDLAEEMRKRTERPTLANTGSLLAPGALDGDAVAIKGFRIPRKNASASSSATSFESQLEKEKGTPTPSRVEDHKKSLSCDSNAKRDHSASALPSEADRKKETAQRDKRSRSKERKGSVRDERGSRPSGGRRRHDTRSRTPESTKSHPRGYRDKEKESIDYRDGSRRGTKRKTSRERELPRNSKLRHVSEHEKRRRERSPDRRVERAGGRREGSSRGTGKLSGKDSQKEADREIARGKENREKTRSEVRGAGKTEQSVQECSEETTLKEDESRQELLDMERNEPSFPPILPSSQSPAAKVNREEKPQDQRIQKNKQDTVTHRAKKDQSKGSSSEVFKKEVFKECFARLHSAETSSENHELDNSTSGTISAKVPELPAVTVSQSASAEKKPDGEKEEEKPTNSYHEAVELEHTETDRSFKLPEDNAVTEETHRKNEAGATEPSAKDLLPERPMNKDVVTCRVGESQSEPTVVTHSCGSNALADEEESHSEEEESDSEESDSESGSDPDSDSSMDSDELEDGDIPPAFCKLLPLLSPIREPDYLFFDDRKVTPLKIKRSPRTLSVVSQKSELKGGTAVLSPSPGKTPKDSDAKVQIVKPFAIGNKEVELRLSDPARSVRENGFTETSGRGASDEIPGNLSESWGPTPAKTPPRQLAERAPPLRKRNLKFEEDASGVPVKQERKSVWLNSFSKKKKQFS